ncbi:MAG: Uma2 family endonuclease, partial [Phototrophicaceae bacterium]
MAIGQQLITIEAYEDFLASHDGLYELIDGEIVEKMVTQKHAKIVGIIIGELYIYLKQHSEINAHMGPEARFRPADDNYNDRLPDVSVHVTDSPPVIKGAVEGMPTLAVEVKSPTDSYKLMREKATYYLANGCQMVWLVYPEKAMVEIYHPEA